MTALAADVARVRAGQLRHDSPSYAPVKAAAVIYAGSGCVLESGYLIPAVAGASNTTYGVARRGATGGAGNGDVGVEVDFGDFWFANSAGGGAVLAAHVGADCYWADDNTVTITATNNTKAGRVIRIDATLGVLVAVGAGA